MNLTSAKGFVSKEAYSVGAISAMKLRSLSETFSQMLLHYSALEKDGDDSTVARANGRCKNKNGPILPIFAKEGRIGFGGVA
jgi:hypothetical protein